MKIDSSLYYEYRSKFMNKCVDMDGGFPTYQPYQCWDGYAHYCNYLGYPYANCTSSGYAKDIWENRKTNGMLNNFTESNVLKPGSITVFKESKETPYSHVAIFDSDVNGTYGRFFGQNQGGQNGAFNITVLPYSATYDTGFIPNKFIIAEEDSTILNKIPNDFIKENGEFTARFTINIRRAPGLKGKLTGVQYESGDSVYYDGYVKREGYVWISWVGKSGKRCWMASGELNEKGININPYGTFE